MADDTITAARKALASALTVSGGLTAYASWPDDFGAVVPAVGIIPKGLIYDVDSGDASGASRGMEYGLIFFAARVSDGMETGMATLGAYLDDREAGSIYALIAADPTLGGACDYCMLKDFADIRLDYVLTPNGPQYIGAIGTLEMAL
jgi:hypothetical protein